MKKSKAILAVALGLALASCAVGVSGPKGNDTGGIIPWSPENARDARAIAQANCGAYGKVARISSVRRAYGEYIAYNCIRPRR